MADDGSIYVAQAGVGGDDCVTDTSGEDPVERCFGPSGEISMVMPGMVHPVLTGLPSYSFAPPEFVGPQDVVLGDDGEVYGIVGLGMDPAIRDAAGDPATGLGTIVTSDGAGGWEAMLDVAAYELEATSSGSESPKTASSARATCSSIDASSAIPVRVRPPDCGRENDVADEPGSVET